MKQPLAFDTKSSNKHVVSRDLNDEYGQYFNQMCFNGEGFVIYRAIKSINKNEVMIYFKGFETPDGLWIQNNYLNLELKHGVGFIKKHREAYLTLQHQLKAFDLEIKPRK